MDFEVEELLAEREELIDLLREHENPYSPVSMFRPDGILGPGGRHRDIEDIRRRLDMIERR